MQGIRILEIPDCKMVSSGIGMFGQEKFDRFDKWFSSLPTDTYSKDYLYSTDEGFCWLYRYSEGMEVPEEFEIVDFRGGLYAVATDIDQHTDTGALSSETEQFVQKYGMEFDPTRPWMGNVITPPSAQELLGYEQMDYFIPIRKKL